MDDIVYISLVPAPFARGTEVVVIGFEDSSDTGVRPELDDQSPFPTEVRGVLLDPELAIPTSRRCPSKVKVSFPRGIGDLQCVVGVGRLGSERLCSTEYPCGHLRVVFHNDFTPIHRDGCLGIMAKGVLLHVETEVVRFVNRVIGQEEKAMVLGLRGSHGGRHCRWMGG